MKKITTLPDAVPDPVRAAAAFIPSPSWALLGIEPLRAAMEYASCRLMDRSGHPPGDGHPVVVFPGLPPTRSRSRRWSASAMGSAMRHATGVAVSHRPHRRHRPLARCAGGRHRGPGRGRASTRVADRLEPGRHLCARGGQAHRAAGASGRDDRNADHRRGRADQREPALSLVNGALPVLEEAFKARLIAAPPVPTTSIYSRSDGVVAWQACLQPEDHPMIENVEVDGSHCGLCWNPPCCAWSRTGWRIGRGRGVPTARRARRSTTNDKKGQPLLPVDLTEENEAARRLRTSRRFFMSRSAQEGDEDDDRDGHAQQIEQHGSH
ncbi:hypothetical protein Ddc_19763 [Ditylenchus destructor]|nr:hypothetical protein Ddc_19763 [Ditylenchus destructor]